MKVLGISALYHDAAAALVEEGRISAAAQEERFTRKKHDSAFPHNAIKWCLKSAGLRLRDVDFVVFYDKPFLKFERLLETYVAYAPKGFRSFRKAMPLWLAEKLFQKRMLCEHLRRFEPNFDQGKLLFSEHHLSHAASAYYPSPFDHAAILTMDGVGEWTTTSLAIGTGKDLAVTKEIHFPHSIGLLYSAFTHYLGFKVNSGEYKVMGLAPYGEPRYVKRILEELIDVKDDGSYRLELSYFDYCAGLTMTSERFHRLFGAPPRSPEQALTQFHMDLAASLQQVTEQIILKMTRSIHAETKLRNLCLAGGVALNCVANGKILRDGAFRNIWIQPAAGDAGGALGAALCGYHLLGQGERTVATSLDAMNGGYLGPAFDQDEVEQRLFAAGAEFQTFDAAAMVETTARALGGGMAVGWFQGRMEFGPRALGNRSILADPRSPVMQKNLNLKIKYRESFRPFAPSVIREDVEEWFDLSCDSPYMQLVADVREERRRELTTEEAGLFGIDKLNTVRSEIPAVTHVDYSARIQTVHRETNPRYHALISRFKQLTGCPVLVNTSFNVRGEPIVCTPEDAFRCFMGSELDVLVVENAVLRKEEQNPALKLDYKNAFRPD